MPAKRAAWSCPVTLCLPFPSPGLQPPKETDLICFVHHCVPRIQINEGTTSSSACCPIHAPQLTKAAGSHVGLTKLRETLNRDGPQGKANRKTLEGQSSIFCGGHCYLLLFGTYCIPGTGLRVKHQRKAQLYLHCGT